MLLTIIIILELPDRIIKSEKGKMPNLYLWKSIDHFIYLF
jgi:hypothetical protein